MVEKTTVATGAGRLVLPIVALNGTFMLIGFVMGSVGGGLVRGGMPRETLVVGR